MIYGEKSTFAIECEPIQFGDNSTYIHFQMWAADQSIGDYTEHISLKACSSWLKDFMLYSDKRYEPSLNDRSKEEVFKLIFDSVMLTIPKGSTVSDVLANKISLPDTKSPVYENTRERFHLDQVGMSSFDDKWNVILVGYKNHSDRLIWRNLDDLQLNEVILPPHYFNDVALQFLHWADSLLQSESS